MCCSYTEDTKYKQNTLFMLYTSHNDRLKTICLTLVNWSALMGMFYINMLVNKNVYSWNTKIKFYTNPESLQ